MQPQEGSDQGHTSVPALEGSGVEELNEGTPIVGQKEEHSGGTAAATPQEPVLVCGAGGKAEVLLSLTISSSNVWSSDDEDLLARLVDAYGVNDW